MRNLVYTSVAPTDSTTAICASQAKGAAGALLINGTLATGGVATLAEAQIVTITSAGNDSGITFTITGTDPDGTTISQAVTGGNATTAVSTFYYKKITGIVVSAAVATTVTVGAVAANGFLSKSLRNNGQQMAIKEGVFVDVISGTLTYTAQYAYQQPEDTYTDSYSMSADWRSVDSLAALAVDGTSNVFYKANAFRLKVTAFTSGTVRLTCTQSY